MFGVAYLRLKLKFQYPPSNGLTVNLYIRQCNPVFWTREQ